jgi:hypothetical protein
VLITPDEGDPGCIANDASITTFTPQGATDSSQDVTVSQPTSITQC